MSRDAAIAAAIAGALGASSHHDHIFYALPTVARLLDKTRPEKRSRTSSHKQNARKVKKKGGTP
jgi:hypothetical protein